MSPASSFLFYFCWQSTDGHKIIFFLIGLYFEKTGFDQIHHVFSCGFINHIRHFHGFLGSGLYTLHSRTCFKRSQLESSNALSIRIRENASDMSLCSSHEINYRYLFRTFLRTFCFVILASRPPGILANNYEFRTI